MWIVLGHDTLPPALAESRPAQRNEDGKPQSTAALLTAILKHQIWAVSKTTAVPFHWLCIQRYRSITGWNSVQFGE